jgi:N6-adenosine-specific RNA methylase IME4
MVERISETPTTVHGRLLEAVHIAGYTFERAKDEFKWLLAYDRWRTVGSGFDDIDVFVASIDWSEFRIAVAERRDIAKLLETARATQRATARMLGVDESTVRADLGKRSAGNPAPMGDKAPETKALEADSAGNPAPEWFQGDIDPAKSARRQARLRTRQEIHADDERRVAALVPVMGKFKSLVIDPPWDYEWLSLAGRAKPRYATMTHDELLALDVQQWAEDGCHLYLWTTNNFMTRAVELMARWGFQHKTILTWVKPRWGLGSYFRNSTEHVLFGVRGDLRTRSDSIATHFEAPVLEHSEKPQIFYDIVGKASYLPCGEAFQRKPREGFVNVFPCAVAA